MAEQTFRSPGFFEREIDLSEREAEPTGTPAGIIGTAVKGPAFVPVTVGSFTDFVTKFGDLDPQRFGPYAVREYLKNKDAVTYLRVLGAGSNDTTDEINNTTNYGIVSKAGFSVQAVQDTTPGPNNYNGAVTFICAKHYISASGETTALPLYTDNDSFPSTNAESLVNLVRGVIFTATGSRAMISETSTEFTDANIRSEDSIATMNGTSTSEQFKTFKLMISSSAGSSFANDDNFPGMRIFTASLDPTLDSYIGKVLNTDPSRFEEEEHLLYLDFAVADEVASVTDAAGGIALTSGSGVTNPVGLSDTWLDSFGRFDTRYAAPQTTSFISQPISGKEWNLFHVEALSDGAYANTKIKISIANLRASTDDNYPYGTFELQVRAFSDTDQNKEVLESYPDCTLDPKSDRYIARMIGDKKVWFNFDADTEEERRLIIEGLYANKSSWIRVVMNDDVIKGDVPSEAMPFGFRGIPVIKTADSLTDDITEALKIRTTTYGNIDDTVGTARTQKRMTAQAHTVLTGAIVPPLPFKFKITTGEMPTSVGFPGSPGSKEKVDGRLYWGTKFERVPLTGSTANAILKPNSSQLPNPIIEAYAKFNGILKLQNLVTGSGKDVFNNNKFTLSRVALSNTETNLSTITGSAAEHMLETAYIRNGIVDAKYCTVGDGVLDARITLATLLNSSSVKFNRFTDYAKFTAPVYGGFDGLNILDKDVGYMTDKAAATDTGGKAGSDWSGGLGLYGTDDGSMMGKGKQNNVVFSYRKAVEMMTDPMVVNTNILAVPGIRDPYITDLALEKNKDYAMAIYLMDMQHYDEDENRLFNDSAAKVSVRETAESFESRRVDNNYSATYFPDVYIEDPVNNRSVKVPSSIAALAALGFNDTVAYPWFAPAGFNRGALDFVQNTTSKLSAGDRDTLYDARINPIANFPNAGFAIFGQKTLQITKSALDRVNVRRLLLEVKRLIVNIAEQLLFEPNTPSTRAKFVGQATPVLALIQTQQGIEQFQVVMDDTNNTAADVEQNQLNGKILLVPTRAIEFIAIDFIITNSGVSFE